jgi:hypothetical protein
VGRFIYAIVVERPDFDPELRRAFGQMAESIRRRDGDICSIELILQSLGDNDHRELRVRLVEGE